MSPHRKKSRGVKSGDCGGQGVRPPQPINLSPYVWSRCLWTACEKCLGVRHHIGTTCADIVPVANLLITPPVFLGVRSNTWDPLGGKEECTAQSASSQMWLFQQFRTASLMKRASSMKRMQRGNSGLSTHWYKKWHFGKIGWAQCMNFLKVVLVELLFMQNMPYACVGDIQGMGNGSNIR